MQHDRIESKFVFSQTSSMRNVAEVGVTVPPLQWVWFRDRRRDVDRSVDAASCFAYGDVWTACEPRMALRRSSQESGVGGSGRWLWEELRPEVRSDVAALRTSYVVRYSRGRCARPSDDIKEQ